MAGDARSAAALLPGECFDHVCLMGPLYHLTEESDRRQAVSQALALLKPGGMLYASFIGLFAGMIYFMKEAPALVAAPRGAAYLRDVLVGKSYGGPAFTTAHFSSLADARALMEGFPLRKLHFLAQEGIMAPCEENIRSQPPEIYDKWLDICEALCEREEYVSFAEHWLYIGKKEGKVC